MCNDYRNRIPLDALREGFPGLETPGGAPNLQPRDDVRITEAAPVVRATTAGGRELVQPRWSWPGPGGKPVYNFRSDGRRFPAGRRLIPADGFYEFTDPEPPAPKRARKTKWLFTLAREPWFCIAGLLRPGAAPDGADAFAMLTTEPGPDVAPIHPRLCENALVRRRALGFVGRGRSAQAWSAEMSGRTPRSVMARFRL